jgi:hypothetical protein
MSILKRRKLTPPCFARLRTLSGKAEGVRQKNVRHFIIDAILAKYFFICRKLFFDNGKDRKIILADKYCYWRFEGWGHKTNKIKI